MAIEVISLTETVPQNGDASISIRTDPGAECFITVEYASGASDAEGLEAQVANDQGVVSWTWRVGRRTTEGTWPITVACGLPGKLGRLETSFTVG
jgi:hypothetical protein